MAPSTQPNATQPNATPPANDRKASRKPSISEAAIAAFEAIPEKHKKKGTILGFAIILVVVAASYWGIVYGYAYDDYFAWVFCFVWTLLHFGGPLVIADYARPREVYGKGFYFFYSLFAISFFVLFVNKFVFKGQRDYYTSILLLFYCFLHFSFGGYSEGDEPATFAKYLIPPAYLLQALSHAVKPSNEEISVMILILGFLYNIVVWIGLMALDRPIDKTKREVTNADGTVKKHVISNNGNYFVVS